MDIEERLSGIRTKLTQSQARKARAEVELEQARERATTAATALKEYGVTSVAEAKRLQAALEADLETALADVEKALEESE